MTEVEIYATFKHSDYVTCTIRGETPRIIKDARISMNSSSRIYICQNEISGAEPNDKLGYKYAWMLDNLISNLKKAEPPEPEPLAESDYF